MSNRHIPKSRIVAAACRNDFLSFFNQCFHFLEPGSPLNLNWHHEAIAYCLDLVQKGIIKRLIIAAPPRTLKSFMTSVAFPAYALGCDPTARIIGISHSADLQIKFSNECRAWIESSPYREFFPRTQLLKNTESEFHTTYGGYRYAKSADAGITGFGGGILILDDFQRPVDMLSESRRTSSNSDYYRTIASRTNNHHTGAIIIVGQRLHMDDLIGRLLQSPEEWYLLVLPAIAEEPDRIPIGPGRWHLRKVGDLLHPEQQSREFLEAFRSEDPETYAAQYQQSPIPSGGFLIKRNQVQYCDELPRRTSSSLYLQSWDTAQKPGETNARSACLDILVQGNSFFIARALVGQWEYHELEQQVLSRAAEQKPDAILVEDTGFGTALISTLNKRKLPVIAVKPEGDKKSRLLRHISKFTNRQVSLLKTAPGRVEFETELFNFPGGRRNDLVDALTQALGHKHVPFLRTDKALDNYGNLLANLAAGRGLWPR
jgi:predicted phage terminase large subunit-like protein